jgi:hypothetical protein
MVLSEIAFSQLCAVCSPFSGVLSVGIFRHQQGTSAKNSDQKNPGGSDKNPKESV